MRLNCFPLLNDLNKGFIVSQKSHFVKQVFVIFFCLRHSKVFLKLGDIKPGRSAKLENMFLLYFHNLLNAIRCDLSVKKQYLSNMLIKK